MGADGQPSRPPRAWIDASALAYADAAVAPQPRTFPRPRPRPRPLPVLRPRRLAYGGVAIAGRVAEVAIDVSSSRMMDRVVRSRVWIGIVAFSLIGIVAMQVSMLKLNSGIGRAVQTASTLERSNAALRADISRRSAGDRIQASAAGVGLAMPAPADVSYLRAGDPRAAAARAAERMRPPGSADGAVLTSRTTTDPGAGLGPPAAGMSATTTTTTTTAPGATAAPGSGPAGAGTTPTAAPGAATTAPTTAPAAAPPATAPPAPPVAAAPAGTAAPATSSGGAVPQATP